MSDFGANGHLGQWDMGAIDDYGILEHLAIAERSSFNYFPDANRVEVARSLHYILALRLEAMARGFAVLPFRNHDNLGVRA